MRRCNDVDAWVPAEDGHDAGSEYFQAVYDQNPDWPHKRSYPERAQKWRARQIDRARSYLRAGTPGV
jgi:hypothetical protein